jgi:hypothetical protein
MGETGEVCGNCGAVLVGDYCHACGQPNRVMVRSIFSLLRDFLHDFVNWDSRVVRTFVPLMFRPGFLSNEYVAGRRARYVPPVKLYLFISIVFFVVLAVVTRVDAESLRQGLAAGATAEQSDDSEPDTRSFTERWGMDINLPWLDEDGEAAFKRRIDRLAENPEQLLRQIRTLAPQMMFLLLPIFALILKVLYLFKRRYYVEHLVLALHTHSFIFLAFLWLFGLHWALRALAVQPAAPLTTGLIGWLTAVTYVWIPVYLFIAQKRFYRQGWFFTSIKYMLTGTVYFTLLGFALAGLVIAGVMTA